jgi:hypothetical protein
MHTHTHAHARQAGFAPPAAELEHKVAAAAVGTDSLREVLGRLKPYTSPGARGLGGGGCWVCSGRAVRQARSTLLLRGH